MESSVIEIREPAFLSRHIHMLLVEDSGMSYESIEKTIVLAAEVVDRITAIACTACRHLSYIRLSLDFACSCKVILHVQTRIIS